MDYLVIRLLSSFLSGIILSQTGSFIQLSTRNILASPSTLGFDGLAILWLLVFHSIILLINNESTSYMLILGGLPIFILVGSLFSFLMKRSLKFERIILLGLTFNLLVGAIFSLWQFFFLAFNLPFPIELWFGHFRYSAIENLLPLILFEIFLLVGLFYQWKELLLYSLGPGLSAHYGVRRQHLFFFLFTSVAVGTFVVVGLFGAFSFLGLIFPLVARKLWFKYWDMKGELLWGSAINGFFLMLTDLVCYLFPLFGAEIPVGLIVTAVGAVSLILLLWKSDSRELLAKTDK